MYKQNIGFQKNFFLGYKKKPVSFELNCLGLVLLDNNTPTQDGTRCFYGVMSVLELNICDYHQLLLNGKQLSKNIPICMTLPNTEELSTVLQFQRRLRNWYWHSRMPVLAPSPMNCMWSWYSWQSFFCPLDSPASWLHSGCPPMIYASGIRRGFIARDLEDPPMHKHTHLVMNMFFVYMSNITLVTMWYHSILAWLWFGHRQWGHNVVGNHSHADTERYHMVTSVKSHLYNILTAQVNK